MSFRIRDSRRFVPCIERLEPRMLLDGSAAASAVLAGEGAGPSAPVPDFELVDVNPSSSMYGQPVSPRDFLGQVSAWMFGYST